MENLPVTRALDLDLQEGWLTAWFNSPDENRNALTGERIGELSELCAALRERSDIRGITLRGRGGIFCAGGDLKDFKAALSGNADREETLAMSREAGALYGAVNALPQFTLMAVEGPCVAGGLGLACCGDMVIAARNAVFSLTEVRIGLSPAQIAPFVVNRIGMRHMRRLALSGAFLKVEEAAEVGLADRLVEDETVLDAAIESISGDVRKCAPGAVSATKSYLLGLAAMERQMQIERAAHLFTDCMFSEEGREGLTAFAEKRAPRWASDGEERS